MNRAIYLCLFAAALLQDLHAGTDNETAARKAVLDLAGAFSNDGFKLRDGNFTGAIQPKQSVIVQVNLYAGNEYWFSVGANDKAKKLGLTIYDETGKPQTSEPYQDESKTAAGFSPEASGPYYVRIEETAGEPANFCLIYSYK
ncbi:MAG: hypothetical protein QOD99_3147 [Chthoniobacter sp.]|nr:hypothetical protein [Chthoniobacter sp.]